MVYCPESLQKMSTRKTSASSSGRYIKVCLRDTRHCNPSNISSMKVARLVRSIDCNSGEAAISTNISSIRRNILISCTINLDRYIVKPSLALRGFLLVIGLDNFHNSLYKIKIIIKFFNFIQITSLF